MDRVGSALSWFVKKQSNRLAKGAGSPFKATFQLLCLSDAFFGIEVSTTAEKQ